jgi:hypothetical protein
MRWMWNKITYNNKKAVAVAAAFDLNAAKEACVHRLQASNSYVAYTSSSSEISTSDRSSSGPRK